MLHNVKVSFQWMTRIALAIAVVSSFLLVGTTTPNASAQAPTVVLVPQGALGMVLSDPDGWTLYTWEGDAEGVSNCYDACAGVWPPYTITGDLISPDDLPASLGLIDRGDGSWQVTVDNWPLYYFSQDNLPGDMNGSMINGFGATWWIMAYSPPAPAAVAPQPAPAQPAPFVPAPIVTSPPAPPVVAVQPPPPAPARQTVQVAIADFEFRPPTVNIQVGDTVNWTNNGRAQHTVTGENGAFDSGRLNAGQSFSQTFNTPGNFPYHCAIHPNMRGVVMVGGPGAAGGQQPFTPNFGPPAVDQGPFYGNQPPFPGGYQGYPGGQPYPYDPNPYDNFPPGVIPPVGAPGFTSMLSVAVPSNGTISLNWIPVQNASSYRIYNTSTATPQNLQIASTVSQSLGGTPVTQSSLAGLAPGQTYLFQVRAVDSNGIETVVPIASPQAGPGGPTLPAGPLTVTGTTGSTVSLSWSALPGASSYRIMQATSPNGPFIVSSAGTTAGTSATVTGLALNTPYYFQVVPVDGQGNSGPPTNTVSATTSVSLVAPTNVAVMSTTGNSAVLSWSSATGATGWRVLASLSPAGPFVQMTTSTPTATGATVLGLSPTSTYYFQVVALDAANNQSPPSTTVFGQTTL